MWIFKKGTGLVLGGGGARGFFHMGVIKAIQEKRIKIDKISGTSIGAVVGAMYAVNPEINFEKLVTELNYFELIKHRGIEPLLRKYVSVSDFSELQIPFCFNAVDINKREEVVFDKGKLFPGLLATVSMPGVFAPVLIGERYLVDGGVINNVPVSLNSATNKLIVSDITGPIKKVNEKTPKIDLLYSSISLMQFHHGQEEIKRLRFQKITYLHLRDNNTFILDFRKKNYQELIDLGYKAMMESGF